MAEVYNLEGKSVEKIELPAVFSLPVREDVIQKVFLILRYNKRQPYGADPMAGKRSSAHYHSLRDYRFTMMNRELSRIPRIHGKVGYMAMRARVAPHAVKGRKAHPPKAQKKHKLKVNKNENRCAILSGIAAAKNDDYLKKRGHVFSPSPVVFVDDFETIKKTKDVFNLLVSVGMEKDLQRCSEKTIRAGKGKNRGRKYKRKKGPLVLISGNGPVSKAARNIPGIDVCSVNDLNLEMLAPGGQPGRLLVTTKKALGSLQKKYGG